MEKTIEKKKSNIKEALRTAKGVAANVVLATALTVGSGAVFKLNAEPPQAAVTSSTSIQSVVEKSATDAMKRELGSVIEGIVILGGLVVGYEYVSLKRKKDLVDNEIAMKHSYFNGSYKY
ncbi:MAG: hypothetical protein KGI06_05600 [Candidatus Micrarchaeota archaeon]|nr:hypothetical protein [Candidatus Micrarchaeota archaeon]